MNTITYFQRVGSFGLYQRSVPLDWMSWPSSHLQTYTSILIKCTQHPVFFKNPHDCAGLPACLCFPLCLEGFFCGCDVTKRVITCMKSLHSHNLTWSISRIHHYWLLLFSRLSKLEETRSCLESGTQTEQEEESSETVSSCPQSRYNNIQLTCWGHQPQGLDFHLHSGSKGQLSCTGNRSELWYILEVVPNYTTAKAWDWEPNIWEAWHNCSYTTLPWPCPVNREKYHNFYNDFSRNHLGCVNFLTPAQVSCLIRIQWQHTGKQTLNVEFMWHLL